MSFYCWTAAPNRASNAAYRVDHVDGSTVIPVDQRQDGGSWISLGTYMLDADSRVTLTDHADGIVVADAMRLVRADDVMAEEVYYIHADHLGTPRAVSDGAGHVVWRWESEPFGNTVPDEDPDGDGDSFRLNLRFPGQYFDGESGLYYNYHRYYDPATGRYLTSDPIGLEGGLNTYAYGNNNPLKFIDPLGLVGQQCDDDREKQCDKQYYDVDIPTCRAIAKRRGKEAGQRCYATAAKRYAACLRGEPIPDLDTYDWRESTEPENPNVKPPWWVPLLPLIPILTPWPDPY